MQQPLDFALELYIEMANVYLCQALPERLIYRASLKNGWALPNSFGGYAFLPYKSQPWSAKNLSSAEVLSFRYRVWQAYFTNPTYLDLVECRSCQRDLKNIGDIPIIH